MATTTTARTRKRAAPPAAPSVAELAEQWLTAKRALKNARQMMWLMVLVCRKG